MINKYHEYLNGRQLEGSFKIMKKIRRQKNLTIVNEKPKKILETIKFILTFN